MKNLISILLSIAFIPIINAQDIGSQFSLLFDAMENRFEYDIKNSVKNEKDKYNEYHSLLAPGGMSIFDARIFEMNNGVLAYLNLIKPEDKDEIIKALESFSISRGYKVETLAKTSNSYHYIVKKDTGKEIGFLKIYKSKNGWDFYANLPLDEDKLKNDIQYVLESAKSGFNTMNKIYSQEGDDTKIYNIIREINYISESLVFIANDDHLNIVYLGYHLTDFEALKYQIRKMNLSLSGYEKKADKNDQNEFSYQFKSKDNGIILEISQKDNPNVPSIIISRQKRKKKPNTTTVAPSKKGVFHKGIIKQIEEVLWQTKGYQRHVDFMALSMKEAREKAEAGKQPEDIKYIFRPLAYKMEACGVGANAGINEMEKAIEMAKKENCENTLAELKRFQDILYDARANFYKAKDAFHQMEYTTSNRSKYVENAEEAQNNFLEGIRNIDAFRTGLAASTMVNNNCVDSSNSSSSNSSSSNSSSELIPPPKDEWKKEDIHTTDKTGKTDLVGVGIYIKEYPVKYLEGNFKVSNTISGWAAHAAGIREGDYIIEVDGKYFKDIKYGSEFQKLLVGKPGTTVTIKYGKRSGGFKGLDEDKKYEYTLTRGASGKVINTTPKPKPVVIAKDEGVGLSVHQTASLTGEILVYQTTSGWAASQAGIKSNMAIVEIDGIKITKDNRYKVKSMLEGKPGTTVKVTFAEKGATKAKIYQLERGKNGKATFLKNVEIIKESKPEPKSTTTEGKNKTVGIGATYYQGKGSDLCEIMWISKSSSAYKAGIREGDFIIKVNDTNAKGKGEYDLKKIIDGKKGTTVKITIDRDGKTQEFTVTR